MQHTMFLTSLQEIMLHAPALHSGTVVGTSQDMFGAAAGHITASVISGQGIMPHTPALRKDRRQLQHVGIAAVTQSLCSTTIVHLTYSVSPAPQHVRDSMDPAPCTSVHHYVNNCPHTPTHHGKHNHTHVLRHTT
jgi:hypothetical protein